MPTVLGSTIAHYKVTAALGQGDTGEVYHVTNTRSGLRGGAPESSKPKTIPGTIAPSPDLGVRQSSLHLTRINSP